MPAITDHSWSGYNMPGEHEGVAEPACPICKGIIIGDQQHAKNSLRLPASGQ